MATREPNYRAAEEFLCHLAGLDGQLGEHTFQVYADSKESEVTPKYYCGYFSQHKHRLASVNNRGGAVCVTVNGTDGKGRHKSNIVLIRAWYTDIDFPKIISEAEKAELTQQLFNALPLLPSILVKTPGGYHLYWLCVPQPCDEAQRNEHEGDLRRIAALLAPYGADQKAVDCSRVLRIPGYYHCKAKPIMISIDLERCNPGQRYKREEILAAFPETVIPPVTATTPEPLPKPPRNPPAIPSTQGGKRSIKEVLDECTPAVSGQSGHNATFHAAIQLLRAYPDLTDSEATTALLEYYNTRCVPPWTPKELSHKVEDARKNLIERQQSQEAKPQEMQTDANENHLNTKGGHLYPVNTVQVTSVKELEPQEAPPEVMKLFEPEERRVESKDGNTVRTGIFRFEPVVQQTRLQYIKHPLPFFQTGELAKLSNAALGLYFKLRELCGQTLMITCDYEALARQTYTDRREFNALFPSIAHFFVAHGGLMFELSVAQNAREYQLDAFTKSLVRQLGNVKK